MSISYNVISKFYGLLDKIYFKDKQKNPRYILSNKIQNNDLNLLEIAVGTAENIILIAKQNPKLNIIGIDLSEQMLKIAQNKITKDNINNVELIKMDATNMTFDNKTFDYIIISLLLHELKEEISNKILNQCLKILKNNGKIYVIEWNYPKKLSQKIKFSMINFLEPFTNKDFTQFVKKDFYEYFGKNGFQIKGIEYGDYTKIMELEKSATST